MLYTRVAKDRVPLCLGLSLAEQEYYIINGYKLKAHTQVKKFRSLELCYIGLYHRKTILSFSTLHLKEMYPISVYFGMFIQLITTISLL